MEITNPQINVSYDVAKRVFENSLKLEAGARILCTEHGMNIVSARDLMRNFLLMLEGRPFYRSMSAPATELYFRRIQDDFGLDALRRAISSVRQHIEYYEHLRNVTLHKLRSVVDHFASQLEQPVILEIQQSEFAQAVNRSLQDSAATRKARLKSAPKLPQKIPATTFVFVRNPDVVAEVLHRAAGSCEHCNSPAPFLRKSTGTPYLEVHHKKQLSEGGEDTVENAMALCPNCHRKVHFGN